MMIFTLSIFFTPRRSRPVNDRVNDLQGEFPVRYIIARARATPRRGIVVGSRAESTLARLRANLDAIASSNLALYQVAVVVVVVGASSAPRQRLED